jgi:hypothetical protein
MSFQKECFQISLNSEGMQSAYKNAYKKLRINAVQIKTGPAIGIIDLSFDNKSVILDI